MTYHRFNKTDFYVYFARAGDMVKVGCSRQPVQRIKQIGEWIPFEIELAATTPGAFDLEADLHAYFADSWSHLEWFKITPKIEAVIADALAGRDLDVPKAPRDNAKELFKTLKKRASRRVTIAESRAGIDCDYPTRRLMRPRYLQSALDSFAGPHQAPPTPEALAAIARYERELAAIRRETA